MLKRPWSHCKYNVPRALNKGETQDKLLPSLIVKDVAEDGGVAEEGVDLEGVGHVEGEELHKDAARRHQHSQASCVEDKVRKALARAIFKFQSVTQPSYHNFEKKYLTLPIAGTAVVNVVAPYLLEEGVVQIIRASRQTWQRHRL